MQKEKQAAIHLLQFINLRSGCQINPQKHKHLEKMPTKKLSYLQLYWKCIYVVLY